jgi:hypothetical protein
MDDVVGIEKNFIRYELLCLTCIEKWAAILLRQSIKVPGKGIIKTRAKQLQLLSESNGGTDCPIKLFRAFRVFRGQCVILVIKKNTSIIGILAI